MIALLSDQTDMEARKAILLEVLPVDLRGLRILARDFQYCQHCNIEKDSRIRVYDPIEATRLNCCGVVPMRLLELSQAEPGPSREVAVILQQMVDQLSGDANGRSGLPPRGGVNTFSGKRLLPLERRSPLRKHRNSQWEG